MFGVSLVHALVRLAAWYAMFPHGGTTLPIRHVSPWLSLVVRRIPGRGSDPPCGAVDPDIRIPVGFGRRLMLLGIGRKPVDI